MTEKQEADFWTAYDLFVTHGESKRKAKKLAARSPHVFFRPITSKHIAIRDPHWKKR